MIQCSRLTIREDIAMALNIRNEETERLAAVLAKLTGETKTEAVTRALRDRLDRVRGERARRRLADELDAIGLHCSRLPVRDARTAGEILGYDEHGVPR
jgi:antitoxin VapB